MNIVFFAGPSLAKEEILAHLEAIVLPPPAQGDLLTALDHHRPQAIAIIDSAFPLSAWVSELHYALRSGVAVYGAGAQGALRAVELQDYGMKGYGKVFDDFASGQQTADDAVLACYREEGGRFVRTTESLVNVEATLQTAQGAGVIDDLLCGRLLQQAQALPWQERTWERILLPEMFAGLANSAAVCAWIQDHPVDIQRQDALELVRAVVADQEALEHRIYRPADRHGMLNNIYRRERKAKRSAGSVPFFSVAHHAAINHPRPLEVNFDGLNRELVVFFAERMELEASETELDYEWTVFKHERGLAEEGVAQWLEDNDLSPEGMDEFIRKNALCRKMHLWMIMRQGMGRATGPFLDALRIRGEYPHYADGSAKIETSKEQHQQRFQSEFCRLTLEETLAIRAKASKKILPWPAPYSQAAACLGITKAELFYELRREGFHQEQTIAAILDTLYEGQ